MKSLGMALGTLLCAAAVTVAAENPLTLWYSSDAGDSFTDALPIGNGYMGGLIYGGVTKDVILLNESTVWSGGPGDRNIQAHRPRSFRSRRSFCHHGYGFQGQRP